MRIVYIFVEGNTDRAFIEALLLKCFNFNTYNNTNDMPSLLARQVPKYPDSDGNLEGKGRPVFLYKDNVGIMIAISGGKEKIAKEIIGRLKVASLSFEKDFDELVLATILDRDLEKNDDNIYETAKTQMKAKGLLWNGNEISFEENRYRFNMYIIPCNELGAVEVIILQLASKIYSDLTTEAQSFRNVIENDDAFSEYREKWASSKEIHKFYADKVQVGTLSSVLKPDSSPAMMVKDRLLKNGSLETIRSNKEIKMLLDFLKGLME